MGKNKKRTDVVSSEEHLLLPSHPAYSVDATAATAPGVIDTHTHIAATFAKYRSKYKQGKYKDAYEFFRAMRGSHKIDAVVDVWCEAPVSKTWREFADSALTIEDRVRKWGGTEYWFVMGVHPHDAKLYTDAVEADILEAMTHPRCVGWGEIGLDYHYDNSPRDVQQDVFTRQLKHAVKLGKPLTIHTREAEDDTERILKSEVPSEHKIHVHCYTDSPELAQRLLNHFPNLHIGITGVITYSTNTNTSNIIRQMSSGSGPLRILLETDAPYMIPGNIYSSISSIKGKLPLCHSAMIPWTAEFVAGVAGQGWDMERVMHVSRENAKVVYGV